ncbi:aspartyl-phosphate phosphatase Spo0E family protein [Garciella nitratireducens]|uniref:Spo0E like sporulation regulatory protein n=1 Tax=Garciella nitratireducens DSM 15102 TaxID=1121911 RepID=A0A1T4MSU8_9FIRM|nr:aspartyl-phosphate phosphatase Spo0E family protein [Garciella nitratireducens]RBP44973.1 Spo0E like sporulation regulatory protein [Garciella nitratireducens]SJZ69825.1 Spo0E like sporulation regulatory protein [Garciella nitratireducens DSM 15102]
MEDNQILLTEHQLRVQIKMLKNRMNQLLEKKHPLNEEIIKVSKELDKLIVSYQTLFL